MKLVRLNCANCGAELELDSEKRQAFCMYCGAKLLIDDENIQITKRIVDEARLKEAEVRLRELEYTRERELREEMVRREQQKANRISIVVLLCLLLVTVLISRLRPFAILVLVAGCIVISATRSEDRRQMGSNRRYVYSEKSRLTALILCLILGPLGIHRFYVGKAGTGALYLFTIGLFGIGWFFDLIRIVCGVFRDGRGCYLKEW